MAELGFYSRWSKDDQLRAMVFFSEAGDILYLLIFPTEHLKRNLFFCEIFNSIQRKYPKFENTSIILKTLLLKTL